MLELSFAGLLGAFLGTGVAALVYGPLVAYLQDRLQAASASVRGENDASPTEPPERSVELSLLRRCVLAADIAVCAGGGYWLAAAIAG